MKRNIVFSFLKAALIFGAFSQTLLGQSDLHLKADIPFAFVADGKIQAPGSYDLQQLRPSVIAQEHVQRFRLIDTDHGRSSRKGNRRQDSVAIQSLRGHLLPQPIHP
jgi:hypothetical protein